MKNKKILMFFAMGLFINGGNLYCQEKQFPQIYGQYRKNLKEVVEIRRRMREIERNAIENDEELKSLHQQIMELRRQLYQKLNEKLIDNSEYQELKRKMQEILKEWKESMEKRRQEIDKRREEFKERLKEKNIEKLEKIKERR